MNYFVMATQAFQQVLVTSRYERIGRSFHANYRSHQKWDSLLSLTYKTYATYELTKMFIPTCTKKKIHWCGFAAFFLAMLATFNHAWTTEESIILFIFKRAKNKRSQSDIPIFILRVVFFFTYVAKKYVSFILIPIK